MGHNVSRPGTGTAGLPAWPSNDSASTEMQRGARSTPTAAGVNLPAPAAARVSGAGSAEYAPTSSRRPLATLPKSSQPAIAQDAPPLSKSSQSAIARTASRLDQLPTELLLPIGEYLLEHREHSSLVDLAATSKRLYAVFSPMRDALTRIETAEFTDLLSDSELIDKNHAARLFDDLHKKEPVLRSQLVHAAIDYIEKCESSDPKTSVLITTLLDKLPELVSGSVLAQAAARLLPRYNGLEARVQWSSLEAVAALIKKLPHEATEPWIDAMTRTLETARWTADSRESRESLIRDLADFTGLVSDEKKNSHVRFVVNQINGLHELRRPRCYSRLEPYAQIDSVGGRVTLRPNNRGRK